VVALLPERDAPLALAERLKASLEERRILDLLAMDAAAARASRGRALTPPHDSAAGAAAWVLSGAARHLRDETQLRCFADWSLTLQDFGRGGSETEHWTAARTLAAHTPVPAFPLTGADLAERGVAPGPAMGALLNGVRQWWRLRGCTATRDECLAELARRITAADPGAEPADDRGDPAGSGTGGGDGTALGG
jgi:poly(A) polymerase